METTPRPFAGEPLSRVIGLTGKVVGATLDQRLAGVGGSLATWIVLRHIDGEPSQRELAERIHLEGPTLVRHLDRLERAGLVERRRDGSDRRVVRVSVTPAGTELRARLLQVGERFNAELGDLLTAEERETVIRALTRVREHLHAGVEPFSSLSPTQPEAE